MVLFVYASVAAVLLVTASCVSASLAPFLFVTVLNCLSLCQMPFECPSVFQGAPNRWMFAAMVLAIGKHMFLGQCDSCFGDDDCLWPIVAYS